MTTRLIVTATDGLRVRLQPSFDGAKVGLIPFGTEIAPDWIKDRWAAFGIYAGRARVGTGYASMDWLQDPDAPAHPLVTFTAMPALITAGEVVTLSWSVEGVKGVRLDGKDEEGVMMRTRTPVQNTIYTLSVTYNDDTTQDFTVSVTVSAAPTRTRKTMIIINNIFDLKSAYRQMELGSPGAAVTHNPNGAYEMKKAYPNAYISSRPLLYGGGMPSHAFWQQQQGDLRGLRDMIAMGLNENNHGDVTTVEGIRDRANWDREQWEWCKAQGYTYVGFGASVGCPDLTKKAMAQAMHDYYKPLWDAGMCMGGHFYSANDGSGLPPAERLFNTDIVEIDFPTWDGKTYHYKGRRTIWLEERWRLWFWTCGFDPRSTAFIWCDECGIDWDGHGGIDSVGWSNQQIGLYYKTLQDIESMPLIVDGIEYPTPVLACAAFERGDPTAWGGYEHSDGAILEIARQVWRYKG